MKFELKKKYESRKEGAYICQCIDAEGDCPIILQSVKDKNYGMSVTKNGFFRPDEREDPGDIIGEWVEPKAKIRLAHCWLKDAKGEAYVTRCTYTEEQAKREFGKKLICWPAVCVDGVYEEPEG